MNMQTSDSIVIIPTYNERENIENIIRAVFALEHGFHILIIEDGSPDGTAAIYSKWMPTSAITPKTCPASTKPAPKKGRIWVSARATSAA